MNEIQLIQQQLATERQHFSAVRELFAAALAAQPGTEESLMHACVEYFEFALMRLPTPQSSTGQARLKAARTADAVTAPWRWQQFLEAFGEACTEHFNSIDVPGAHRESVLHWRSVARLDADAIVGERERFARIQARVSSPQ
ncbi:MAG TPA: hypothetical protein VGL55_16030 [Steroidobacteraceae bacterium]|jgi:hypothetical protein